jgi:hypothetical protein
LLVVVEQKQGRRDAVDEIARLERRLAALEVKGEPPSPVDAGEPRAVTEEPAQA